MILYYLSCSLVVVQNLFPSPTFLYLYLSSFLHSLTHSLKIALSVFSLEGCTGGLYERAAPFKTAATAVDSTVVPTSQRLVGMYVSKINISYDFKVELGYVAARGKCKWS
jgi:hypothetical protein